MLILWLLIHLYDSSDARTYDTYRADYAKGAFCSAIGGACSADIDPENAYFQNPAALAAGKLGLSFDGDYNSSANLEPGMKAKNDVSEASYMGGISYSWTKFGIGLSINGRNDTVRSQASLLDDQGKTQVLSLADSSTRVEVRLPIAFGIAPKWTVGVGFTTLFYKDTIDLPGATAAKVTQIEKFPSLSLTVGVIYAASQMWKFGSWIKTPQIYYENVKIHVDTFGNTLDYQEDVALRVPWIWSTGARWSPGPRGMHLFFDVDVIGATQNGYLLTYDTFAGAIGERGLTAKGRNIAVEPHVGWSAPWTASSRGTYLLGSYYENGRTQAINGRVHGTAGIAYDLKNWVEGLVGIDFARDFFQVLLTVR